MNEAVKANGGELGATHGSADVLGQQFAIAVNEYEHGDPNNAIALSAAYGSLTAIAAMAIGALERAEQKSHDPLDLLRREAA